MYDNHDFSYPIIPQGKPITEGLTKENFFNELYKSHEPAVKKFCDWIDEYKKRVNWNKLFNSDSDWQDVNGKNAPAPKFHDLPIGMQIGIFIQFTMETSKNHFFETGPFTMEQFIEGMRRWFFEEDIEMRKNLFDDLEQLTEEQDTDH